MWQDPIVSEIHQTREQLSKAYGDDLHRIFLAAQRGELLKPLAGRATRPAKVLARRPHAKPRKVAR